MRRKDITPGFYEAVTLRGRRNRVEATEVVRVVAEPYDVEPRHTWAVPTVEVPVQRAQLRGLFGVTFALADIRRRIVDPAELAKHERDFALAGEHGFVHKPDGTGGRLRGGIPQSIEFERMRLAVVQATS